MQIDTRGMNFARLLPVAGDTTDTGSSIADPADMLTDPLGTANHIDMGGPPDTANALVLLPFGTATAAQTFLLSVFACRPMVVSAIKQWTYHLLAAFTCTLCTKTGKAGGGVNASQLYCDTITLTANSGNANVSDEIVSPTGNQAAHIVVDTKGALLVACKFSLNSSAASANLLFGKI